MHEFFCGWLSFFPILSLPALPPPAFILEEEERKGTEKEITFFLMMLYCLLEKRSTYETLSLSDSLYDSASWCLPTSDRLLTLHDGDK